MINIKSILFDLDGVLVDACEWHYLSFNKALKKKSNIEIGRQEHKKMFNGIPTKKKIEILVKQNRVKEEDCDSIWRLKQKLTEEIIISNCIVDKNKIDLLHRLKEKNILVGCVTNSIKKTAELMLKSSNIFCFMDTIITNQCVSNPKPSPEGYFMAMKTLNVSPDEVIIVEDSPKGIQAAKKTACKKVLQVKNAQEVTTQLFNKILWSE